jgi:hypothetical protein
MSYGFVGEMEDMVNQEKPGAWTLKKLLLRG